MKKWLIIDTCIWAYYFKYPEAKEYINSIIASDKYELCTNEFIKYELEIGFRKSSELNIWQDDIVNKLTDIAIHPKNIKEEFIFYKKKLIDINNHKKESDNRVTPSVADAILAYQMIQYGSGSFIMLTANHKDFPTQVFNRDKTDWINIPGSPISFCFYSYKK